eukprot:COSAG01_NODE_3372_length_6178_cov_83.041125_1_plen_27_part_10
MGVANTFKTKLCTWGNECPLEVLIPRC